MSEYTHESHPMTPVQYGVISAINTAPKALLHIAVDTPNWLSPSQLDEMFMDLQGPDPTWLVSRGYVRSIAIGDPLRVGMFETRGGPMSTDEGPLELRRTEMYKYVGAPAAAHLITVADIFDVRQSVLVGESGGSAKHVANSPVRTRFRATHALLDLGLNDSFSVKELSETLGCSISTASGITSDYSQSGFCNTDPLSPPVRNGYATYRTQHTVYEGVVTDPLYEMVLEELEKLTGEQIDAKMLAQRLGYNVKYVGKEIADFLDTLHSKGLLVIEFDKQERLRRLQLTQRGHNALSSLKDIYDKIEHSDAAFQRRGEKLAEAIQGDPSIVIRALEKAPTKRGQKKQGSLPTTRETPAVDVLMDRIKTLPLSQTSTIQKITGVSRTATTRLLNQAAREGRVQRVKRGREYLWRAIA